MILYHLSSENMDGKTLTPRIPNNWFTYKGYENNKTPRVCFAPSIDNALCAMARNISNQTFYVHIPVHKPRKIIKPTRFSVPDAHITKEIWVTEDVKIKCIGKIKITGDGDSYPFRYGKFFQHKEYCDAWKWKWIDKPTNNLLEVSMLLLDM